MPSRPESVKGLRKIISLLAVRRSNANFLKDGSSRTVGNTVRPRPGAMIAQITQTQRANAPAGVRA